MSKLDDRAKKHIKMAELMAELLKSESCCQMCGGTYSILIHDPHGVSEKRVACLHCCYQ